MSRQVGAKRRKYDPCIVDIAADAIRNGCMSLGKASEVYNIPKTTLHDRVKRKYASATIGAKTVLSPEENTIEQWAVQMSRIGYGRARRELAHIVKQILDEDGRKTPFVNNILGRKWMEGFFYRHPSLNLITTVQLEKREPL
ncbi:hypothetical protein DPMN_165417 [Dreissena polymorpha]|uniref:HTH psq-type domain-containing protein n=1 Tax=Dreissena polymorpha TaxID=45954 RepID=A0A9D4IT84_DREPO|nr:hypothetical protein DPMN_165417 [Dreissena polymorpha]